jgi:hypothetical protein
MDKERVETLQVGQIKATVVWEGVTHGQQQDSFHIVRNENAKMNNL